LRWFAEAPGDQAKGEREKMQIFSQLKQCLTPEAFSARFESDIDERKKGILGLLCFLF